MTIRKKDVPQAMRMSDNILYNYATRNVLCPETEDIKSLHLVPDKKFSVRRLTPLIPEHLQYELAVHYNRAINITCGPKESTFEKRIWFADWIANFTWRASEQSRTRAYDELLKGDFKCLTANETRRLLDLNRITRMPQAPR